MMDRAKEMIFNILGESVRDARVLDLFAGSGSLGIEALSRGATHVTFVESGIWAQKCIRENLERLSLGGKARVVRKNVFRVFRGLQEKGETFTLIFLDPPYDQGLVKKLLIQLDHFDIVTPHTQVVLHHSRREKLPKRLEGLKLTREKRFGQACLSFLFTGRSPATG